VEILAHTMTEIWTSILRQIESKLDAKELKTWFGPTRQLDLVSSSNGPVLTILVPSRVFADWIQSRHGEMLARESEAAGFPGLEITEWQGLFVPAKTPPPVVHALNRSVRDALDTAEVKAGLIKLSFEAGGTSPEQFADIVRADIARWEPIVKASGFTPEN